MPWNPVPGVKVVTLAKALLAAVIACVLSFALGGGLGLWAGIEWQQGRQAQADIAQAEDAYKALSEDFATDRRNHLRAYATASQDLRTASLRLETIATTYEATRDENERQARALRDYLEAELARRPDLDAVRVGPGLLCAWNRAALGADSGGAAAAPGAVALPGCGLDGAVPDAASGRQRPVADPAAAPRHDQRR